MMQTYLSIMTKYIVEVNPMVASSQIDEYREHKDALIEKWSKEA